jgi:hypothetical protein
MLRVSVVAGWVLAGALCCAGTAQAGTVLKVDDGRARVVHDRLVPPASKTRLPAVPARTRLLPPRRSARITSLASQPPELAAALSDARATRDTLPTGPARDELTG